METMPLARYLWLRWTGKRTIAIIGCEGVESFTVRRGETDLEAAARWLDANPGEHLTVVPERH